MTDNPCFWPDGTPKSRGNAFTAHNYVRGSLVMPTPMRQRHVKAGFGAKGGTIPGMGTPQAPDFNTVIKKRA